GWRDVCHTNGMREAAAASLRCELLASRTAAATKIQGEAAPIASAKGVSTRAKMIDRGIAMLTDYTPPEIALCRAMWGMPSERSSWDSSRIGTAEVSPGMPS